jgi:hypothetical protein
LVGAGALCREDNVFVKRTGIIAFMAIPLIALAQSQVSHQIYDRPITDSLRLRVNVTDTHRSPGVCCSTVARILLVDRRDADHPVELAAISEEYETAFAVERADDRLVVLSRSNPDHGGLNESIKLFFDPSAKRLLKRIDFDSAHDIAFGDDGEAARVLGVAPDAVPRLRERRVFSGHPEEPSLPPAFTRHPLPQSTYQAFADARPDRVRNGYEVKGTTIEERIGSHQREGNRLWFGKTFYDGEGTTGVGAIGSLSPAGAYAFLRIPELFDWSVQGLLVEPAAIWAGRVSHGEGADHSGGLLRYDRKTRRVRLYDIPDEIHAIAHVGDAVFVGTGHGLYVIRNDTKARYRIEPDITGRFIVMAENMMRESR